jgi:16S rRNA (uracil1498-N3)-methyltransferase
LSHGFRSVHLGRSRLRTETAALVAVHLMRIKHEVE